MGIATGTCVVERAWRPPPTSGMLIPQKCSDKDWAALLEGKGKGTRMWGSGLFFGCDREETEKMDVGKRWVNR